MLLTQVLSNAPFFGISTTSALVVTATVIAILSRVAGLATPMLMRSDAAADRGLDLVTPISIVYGVTGLVAAIFADRSTKTGRPPQFPLTTAT